jgi:hypothetical protein
MRTQTRLWLGRLGWMAALWAAGVGVLGIVAVVLHFAMRAAGMR